MKKYKFTDMLFYGGYNEPQYVLRKSLYTKEQALDIAKKEIFDYTDIENLEIYEAYCKHCIKAPQYTDYEGSCYVFADSKTKGSFEVWVVQMKEKQNEHRFL